MGTVAANVSGQFGMFSVSFNVASAVEDNTKGTHFNILCQGVGDKAHPTHPPAQIGRMDVCPVCENKDAETFVMGRKVGEDSFVIVGDEEVEEATGVPTELKKTMAFTPHPAGQLEGSVLPGGKVYYLEPSSALYNKAYASLAQAIREDSGHAWVCVWAPRSKLAWWRLVPYGRGLALECMAWPAQIRPQAVPDDAPDAKNVKQFHTLTELLVEDFDPATYRDQRVEKIAALVEARKPVEGISIEAKGKAPAPTSLEDALAASIQAATAKVKPIDKATAKPHKAAAKKAAAKKTVAKKATPARKKVSA